MPPLLTQTEKEISFSVWLFNSTETPSNLHSMQNYHLANREHCGGCFHYELHTISLRQTECRKTGETITAAVYEYLVDNDGEWGEIRFDFESGTAEIVKLAVWDTVKSNIFAKTAIQFVQRLPEARMLKSVVVPFWKGRA